MKRLNSDWVWLSLGLFAAVLGFLFLAQTAFGTLAFVTHAITLSPGAFLNPLTSPFPAVATAFGWVVWTLARAGTSRRPGALSD